MIATLNSRCYLMNEAFHVKAAKLTADNCSGITAGDRIYRMKTSGYAELLGSRLEAVQKNMFPQVNSRTMDVACYRNFTLVGTFGQGFFLYNDRGELVTRMDKTTGLCPNGVSSLLVGSNRLFIGSKPGLIKADLPLLQPMKLFKETEGMFTWECRPTGLKKLSDGLVVDVSKNLELANMPVAELNLQNQNA